MDIFESFVKSFNKRRDQSKCFRNHNRFTEVSKEKMRTAS